MGVRHVLIKTKQNRVMKSFQGPLGEAAVRPEAFVFCERDSGTVRFQIEATSTGELPVEQAASLMAMHCLVRGQTPDDYIMMTVPVKSLVDPVLQRACELLEAGRAIRSDVSLTSREHEVL